MGYCKNILSLGKKSIKTMAAPAVKIEKPGPPPLILFVTNAKSGKTEWVESSVKVPVSRLKRYLPELYFMSLGVYTLMILRKRLEFVAV